MSMLDIFPNTNKHFATIVSTKAGLKERYFEFEREGKHLIRKLSCQISYSRVLSR